jgi:hypothetical protein
MPAGRVYRADTVVIDDGEGRYAAHALQPRVKATCSHSGLRLIFKKRSVIRDCVDSEQIACHLSTPMITCQQPSNQAAAIFPSIPSAQTPAILDLARNAKAISEL